MEDVSDIVLNVKGLVLAMEGDEPRTIRVSVSGPGDVTGELVQSDANVEVVNKDHLLATLTDEIEFTMEMVVERGRGYRPASETWANTAEEDMQIGDIPVDAAFSPVERVRYRVENTRLGQRTNYERLVLDVWTKASLAPEMPSWSPPRFFASTSTPSSNTKSWAPSKSPPRPSRRHRGR